MVKVSFITAIYNVAQYLPRCIESMLDQGMKDVELLLVNDGSTDDSLAICHSYAEKDGRIRVLDQENRGANAARNRGLQEARGEWVYFVDGDDFVDATVCTGVQPYLDADYDMILFSHARYSGGQIKPVPYAGTKMEFRGEDFKELQLSALNRMGNYRYHYKVLDAASLWNKFYRRDFLAKHGLLFVADFPKLQDMSFNLMVYDHARSAVYIPNIGYYYQYNEQSVSHRYQEDLIKKFDVINAWFERFIAGKGKDERFVKAYRERIATHMRTCIVLYFCNRKNPAPYRKRRAEFMALRGRKPYGEALDQTAVRAFRGYKEQILAFSVKYRLFGLCEMLCILYDKLR